MLQVGQRLPIRLRFPIVARSLLRCSTIKNGSRPSGNEKNIRPGIHLTLVPLKALCATPLLMALASSLPGIEVCFRLVQACPAACVCRPATRSILDVRPSGRAPAQVGNEKKVRPGIHLTPCPNESPLRKTSSDGIGIVIAGD